MVPLNVALLIDFGSTYTKITAVDIEGESIIGTAQAPTTVNTNIMEGLNNALAELRGQSPGCPEDFNHKLACSSAAGGLKMVAIGLVPDLTAEAAKRAALGAGAKVLKVFSHQLTPWEMQEMAALGPEIVLLAGGTDGGNTGVILHNAAMLAKSGLKSPVVVAGNKAASGEIRGMLEAAGIETFVAGNVLPELSRLDVDPARQTIREVFMSRIVQAKGLDSAQTYIDGILMPTPAAVLNASKLLAGGYGGEDGLGDLVVLDVGGATTDVHSMADGDPTRSGVMFKGLPEPYAKRTVEGDLGMRYNAQGLLDAAGPKKIIRNTGMPNLDVENAIGRLTGRVEFIPASAEDHLIDRGLGRTAVELAMDRHAGRTEVFYSPMGPTYLQYGKDLTRVECLIGTGGVLVHGSNPAYILQGALFNESEAAVLKPQSPGLFLDEKYILAAMGLLGDIYPQKAVHAGVQPEISGHGNAHGLGGGGHAGRDDPGGGALPD